jgi:O-antigen ligase
LFAAAVISALFACVDFYFQFPAPAGFGPQFVWLDTGVYRRAQGFFYEASTLGNFCTFFLVFVAVCFTSKSDERPVPRIWLACGTIVFSLALVLSYSRASIGNLAIALFVLLLRRKILRVARLLFLLPLAGLVSYVAFPVFTRLYWERLWASTVYFFSYTEGIFSGRFASWRAIGDFLLRNPLSAILGVGYKTLPYSDVMGRPVVADNMYLSLLVETGIVGLAAMLFLNVAILRAAARSAKHSFFGEWIFCFWIGQIFQMLSGDLLTYWRVLPVYFWVLAMAVRRSREDSLPRSV